jgi:hypothetical protein
LEATRRAALVALAVSGLWLVVAVVLLTVAAVGEGRDDHHGHDNGVPLLFVLVGFPVLTWIGAHLVISLCFFRGQGWARGATIGAFAISGLLPLWLFPLHLAGTPGRVALLNAVLCTVVVVSAVRARSQQLR